MSDVAPEPGTPPSPGPQRSAAVLDFAGAPIAFGLSWRRLRGHAAPDREARAEARLSGAAAVAIRPQRRHYGLARNLELPRMRRVKVAAAAIADAYPHSLIAAWPLPDGRWWCAALNGGEVYPQFGDLLVDDEQAAADWFSTYRHECDWSTLAVPHAWEPGRAAPVDLGTILAAHTGTTLEPVRSSWPGSPRRVAASVLVLATIGLGSVWLLMPERKPTRPPPPVAATKPSIASIHTPTAFAATCLRLIESVSPLLPSAGWSGTRSECSLEPGMTQVRLKTSVKPLVREALGLLPIAQEGTTVDHVQGTAMIERIAALPTTGRPAPDPAPDAAALAQTLVSAATRAGARLAIDPGARLPGQTLLRWSADSIRYLPAVIAAFEAVPGVRLTALELDLNTFGWILRGEAHVAPYS